MKKHIKTFLLIVVIIIFYTVTTEASTVETSISHSTTVQSGKTIIKFNAKFENSCVMYIAPVTGEYKIKISNLEGGEDKPCFVRFNIYELGTDNTHYEIKNFQGVKNFYQNCRFYIISDESNTLYNKIGHFEIFEYSVTKNAEIKVNLKKGHKYCMCSTPCIYETEEDDDSIQYTYEISIKEPIYLNKKSTTLKKNSTLQLKLINASNNKKITWKSSDNSVATVTNGLVKAKKIGNVTVTATYNNTKYKCKIIVK